MPVLTLLPTLLKPFRNYDLRFWSIAHIVLTLPLWTVTCLVHLKKPEEVYHGPANEGNGACMACPSAQNVFSEGIKKTAVMDKINFQTRGLC
jgi:hypothetical protein